MTDDPSHCDHELHGADGGPCPDCGRDSHPIPDAPAPVPTSIRELPTMTQPIDPVTAALAARWHVRPGDLGVCVATEAGTVVDLVLDERVAEHIAETHNARLDGLTDAMRPIVAAQIGAHLAAQSDTVTRYGVLDAAGQLHDAYGPADALETAADPDHRHGPQPRHAVWWTETRGPLLPVTSAPAEGQVAA